MVELLFLLNITADAALNSTQKSILEDTTQ